jgi:ribosomal protein L39E
MRLGKELKKARRIPLLAIVRTHRKIQTNNFARNWRRTKLKIDKA